MVEQWFHEVVTDVFLRIVRLGDIELKGQAVGIEFIIDFDIIPVLKSAALGQPQGQQVGDQKLTEMVTAEVTTDHHPVEGSIWLGRLSPLAISDMLIGRIGGELHGHVAGNLLLNHEHPPDLFSDVFSDHSSVGVAILPLGTASLLHGSLGIIDDLHDGIPVRELGLAKVNLCHLSALLSVEFMHILAQIRIFAAIRSARGALKW